MERVVSGRFDTVRPVTMRSLTERSHDQPSVQSYKLIAISSLTSNVDVLFPCASCSTRNSSEMRANVNFLFDDIVHVIQNTTDSCINSATDRRGGYVLERMFTKFSEITQCNGHYAAQGHSRSPILAPIESSYTTSILVINTNLHPILHRFQVTADYSSNFR